MMKSEVSQRATKILMLELLRLAILSWACITSVPNTNTATMHCVVETATGEDNSYRETDTCEDNSYLEH